MITMRRDLTQRNTAGDRSGYGARRARFKDADDAAAAKIAAAAAAVDLDEMAQQLAWEIYAACEHAIKLELELLPLPHQIK